MVPLAAVSSRPALLWIPDNPDDPPHEAACSLPSAALTTLRAAWYKAPRAVYQFV